MIYDVGVDVMLNDIFGYFDFIVEGLYRRERMVMDIVFGVGIFFVGVVGGGYLLDIDEFVSCYVVLYCVVCEMFVDYGL